MELDGYAESLDVAAYIRNIEVEAAIKEARKAMDKRDKALTRKSEWLREYLKTHMEGTKIQTIKNCFLALSIRNNPPSVVVTNEKIVPAELKHT